jgi:hypothetical protein
LCTGECTEAFGGRAATLGADMVGVIAAGFRYAACSTA